MLPNNQSLGKFRSMLIVIPLIIATLIAYSPSKALGDHESDEYEFGNYDNAIKMMANYWYLKKVMKIGRLQSYCYFDPNVDRSMACSFRFGQNANKSKNEAKKACKKRGGSKCTLFWSNGKIKYKGLSETGANKLNAVAQRIGQEEIVAEPLIEGDVQSEASQKRFQRDLEGSRNWRKSRSNQRRHFVMCGTGYKLFTTSGFSGTRSRLKHVRKMCVLRCRAIVDYHDLGKQCFIFVEDGEFVSSEAERIFME